MGHHNDTIVTEPPSQSAARDPMRPVSSISNWDKSAHQQFHNKCDRAHIAAISSWDVALIEPKRGECGPYRPQLTALPATSDIVMCTQADPVLSITAPKDHTTAYYSSYSEHYTDRRPPGVKIDSTGQIPTTQSLPLTQGMRMWLTSALISPLFRLWNFDTRS